MNLIGINKSRLDKRVPRAEIFLQGSNGYGTTNTYFRRWTNVVTNEGRGSLSLTQSAANGDSITVLADGFYSILYTEVYGVLGGFGIRLNQTSNGWLGQSIPAAEVIAAETSGGNNHMATCTCILWLRAGDNLVANGDTTAAGTFGNYAGFRVVRLA